LGVAALAVSDFAAADRTASPPAIGKVAFMR
jgi:hypothetical protein